MYNKVTTIPHSPKTGCFHPHIVRKALKQTWGFTKSGCWMMLNSSWRVQWSMPWCFHHPVMFVTPKLPKWGVALPVITPEPLSLGPAQWYFSGHFHQSIRSEFYRYFSELSYTLRSPFFSQLDLLFFTATDWLVIFDAPVWPSCGVLSTASGQGHDLYFWVWPPNIKDQAKLWVFLPPKIPQK